MALKRLGAVDLVSTIQDTVKRGTGKECYDYVEENTPSPFYYVEFVRMEPANSKTMFRDKFTVWIHAIAEPEGSSVGIYDLIQKLEEAMTEEIVLPEDFELIMQTYRGVQAINTDETGEKHAVCEFEFMISYGFMCKI